MNLYKLATNINYHERVADATADRKLAKTHRDAAALLRSAYDAAHLADIQRQAFITEKQHAASRRRHRRP